MSQAKEKPSKIPAGYVRVGAMKKAGTLRVGDVLQSPCSDGMTVKLIRTISPKSARFQTIHEPGGDFEYEQVYLGGSHFPSWTLYRPAEKARGKS